MHQYIDGDYVVTNYDSGAVVRELRFVPVPTADPVTWLIDIGPFTDRFSTSKTAVDFSTDPVVMAFDKDLGRRKWIDLKDPRVAAVLSYLTGATVPGMGTLATPLLTGAQMTAILTTPVSAAENLALRKLYFS
jgi:hypothetical protein